MRKCVNGKMIEMTTEEIAELELTNYEEQKREREAEPTLTLGKKVELFVNAIPTQASPTMKPKVGYKWQAIYSGEAGFAWELVADPNAIGTMTHPLHWVSAMAVESGLHYTIDGKTYVAIDDGVPTGADDERYFAEI